MATSSNRDYFFQTTASNAENERKQRKSANTFGAPLKFSTKLLAIQVNYPFDNNGQTVFVAEAGGNLTAVILTNNKVTVAGKPAPAPLTSLAYALIEVGISSPFATLEVFAGCWNKNITKYSFAIDPRPSADRPVTQQNTFPAHRDFVKCLLVAPTPHGKQVLVSGGADGEVNFWTLNGDRLATLRPNCRSIECLALDPLSSPHEPVIVFGTSQREIFQVILPSLADFSTHNLKVSPPIIAHETSVYKIFFDDDGDMWTASADKTAKHLSREHKWMPDTTLTHPDFVKDVIVHNRTKLVVTACRDEEVRVWNGSTSQLIHVFSGHYEEVTGLAITGDLLLSVSIDGTLRRWSLAPGDLQREIEKAKNPDLLAEIPEPSPDMSMLTAEEEAELRALMEEEEADGLAVDAQ